MAKNTTFNNILLLALAVTTTAATAATLVLVTGSHLHGAVSVGGPGFIMNHCAPPSVVNAFNSQYCTCPYTEYTLSPETSNLCKVTNCSPQGQKAHHLLERPMYCKCDEPGYIGNTFLPNDTTDCPAPTNGGGGSSSSSKSANSSGNTSGECIFPAVPNVVFKNSCWCPAKKGYRIEKGDGSCVVEPSPTCITPAVDDSYGSLCVCNTNPSRLMVKGDPSCNGGCMFPSIPNASNPDYCTCPSTKPYTLSKANSASCVIDQLGCIAPAVQNPSNPNVCTCPARNPYTIKKGDSSCKAPSECISPAEPNKDNPDFCSCYMQNPYTKKETPYTMKKGDPSCKGTLPSCIAPAINDPANPDSCLCLATKPYSLPKRDSSCVPGPGCIAPAVADPKHLGFCVCGSGVEAYPMPQGDTKCVLQTCPDPTIKVNNGGATMCLCPAKTPYTFVGVGPDVAKNAAACKAEIDAEANAPKGCIAPAHVDPQHNTFCICDENPPRELQQGDASCQAPAGGSCISPAVINATNSNFCTCPAVTPYTIKKNDASCDLTYRGGGGTTGGGGNTGDCTVSGFAHVFANPSYVCTSTYTLSAPLSSHQIQKVTIIPTTSNWAQVCKTQCESDMPSVISTFSSYCHGSIVNKGCSM